jgi:hypothetical protein
MRVTFDGILPEHGDQVQQMKNVMSPTLISRHPADWIRYETFHLAKQLADDAMRVGELHLAEEMLITLLEDTAGYLHALTLPAPGSPPQPVSPQNMFWPTVKLLHILRLDIVLTLGYLQLKLGLLQRLGNTAGLYVSFKGPDWHHARAIQSRLVKSIFRCGLCNFSLHHSVLFVSSERTKHDLLQDIGRRHDQSVAEARSIPPPSA